MTIRATDVTVRYPRSDRPAVVDASFTLGSGELVVVAGPNGSGKSSLFRAMLGIVPLEAGAVTVLDRAVSSWPRAELARVVAAMPQREEPAFSLRVREAVMMGRWASLGPFAAVGAADRAALDRAIARCHLDDLVERGTDTLSGGEWQRVRVARALAAEPRFLLLDEPGTALDLAHEMALFELLRDLVAGGIGVLAITHHLNLALRYADRVVLFDRGRIAADGAPATVLTASLLSTVFRWPVSVRPLPDGTPHLMPLRRDEVSGPPSPLMPTDPHTLGTSPP